MSAPVIRVRNKTFSSNTYLCRTETPGECIVVDPGLDADLIEAALAEAQLVPKALFCTHGHFDHVGTAEHFRRKYAVDLHLPEADQKVMRSSNFLMMAFKIPGKVVMPEQFTPFGDGFTWSTGLDQLRVLHAPGHTPGSSFLLYRGHAFTGDTLYRDGVNLVSLPGEDKAQLAASLHKAWNLLPDDTIICPGHGGSGPFGDIKRANAPLRRLLGFVESPPS